AAQVVGKVVRVQVDLARVAVEAAVLMVEVLPMVLVVEAQVMRLRVLAEGEVGDETLKTATCRCENAGLGFDDGLLAHGHSDPLPFHLDSAGEQ
ncbi:MAG: hypothetical protein ACKVHP_10165, partial [Verrucomicrobiales bacterium]